MKHLFKRHPDIWLKSISSTEEKINFLKYKMNRDLKQEEHFPVILKFNFNEKIRPRCELVFAKNRDFNIGEVLKDDDETFCENFGIEYEDLLSKKAEFEITEEKDVLWQYVPGK